MSNPTTNPTRPDNPPAFPIPPTDAMLRGCACDTGMSLRDYFAAKALGGYCASGDESTVTASVKHLARWSYELADAMLAERSRAL